MRKLVANHGSPKFTINMDKTPTVVGGKKEHFGSISVSALQHVKKIVTQ